MKVTIGLLSIFIMYINSLAQNSKISQVVLQYSESIKVITDTVSEYKREKWINNPSSLDFFSLNKSTFSNRKEDQPLRFKLTEISGNRYIFDAYNNTGKKIYEIRLVDSINFAVGYTILFDNQDVPVTDSYNLLYIDKKDKEIFFIEWRYKPNCNRQNLNFSDYCDYMSISTLSTNLKPISRLLILSERIRFFSKFKDNASSGNVVEDIYFINPYSRCGSKEAQFIENMNFTDLHLMNIVYDCLTIKMGTLHNSPFLYDLTVFWEK